MPASFNETSPPSASRIISPVTSNVKSPAPIVHVEAAAEV